MCCSRRGYLETSGSSRAACFTYLTCFLGLHPLRLGIWVSLWDSVWGSFELCRSRSFFIGADRLIGVLDLLVLVLIGILHWPVLVLVNPLTVQGKLQDMTLKSQSTPGSFGSSTCVGLAQIPAHPRCHEDA